MYLFTMTKIILFFNQKGGVGKTTISTNLAVSLHLDNQKILKYYWLIPIHREVYVMGMKLIRVN